MRAFWSLIYLLSHIFSLEGMDVLASLTEVDFGT
jgi:hypothetical protein